MKNFKRALLITLSVLLLSFMAGVAFAQSAAPKKVMLVSSIRLRTSSVTVTLTGGREHTFDSARGMQVSPYNADEKRVEWLSSDPSVARVDPVTGRVSMVGEGTATITARAVDGSGVEAGYTVKGKAVRVTKLTIGDDVVTLNPSERYRIEPKIKPANATYQEPSYSSDNPGVAEVSADGEVTARSSGVATITVKVDKKSAKCRIQVRSSNPQRFSMSAVGDVIVGGDPERGTLASFKKYLKKYGEETGDPYTGMLINASKYFHQTDMTLANLECTLTTGGTPRKAKYHFKGNPDYANILSRSGITAVNLANNHTADYGSTSYSRTKSAVRRAGVAWNGNGYKESEVITVNGLRVGLIGFQTGIWSTSRISRDVKKLRKECDVLIASMHFGDVKEYTFKVTGKQKSYARSAVNAGADLVVGHHPHVISGMECYKGRNIVYGLGSFLSVGPNPKRPRRTFIYQQEFLVHQGFVEPANTRVVPFWITSSSTTNDMRPQYAPGDEAQIINQMIDKYSVGKRVEYTLVSQ